MSSLIDKILLFINRYYLDPIMQDSGYNPVNTLTWALILGVCVFGVAKLMDRLNIKVDEKFVVSIIPFILAGSSLRVIEDAGLFEPPLSYLLITPNIYFVVFCITLVCLLISKWLFSRGIIKDMHKIFAGFGGAWFVINIITLLLVEDVTRPFELLLIIFAGTLASGVVYLLIKWVNWIIVDDRLNIMIIYAHLLDASSTFVGVDLLGYYEKHVVPAYLIELTGTAFVMYPLKLAIFIPVLFVLDSQFKGDEESESLRTFVKMVILILGLSPACRNTIRMALGI